MAAHRDDGLHAKIRLGATPKAVASMLAVEPALVFKLDERDRTPLHSTLSWRCPGGVVRSLLDFGPAALRMTDKAGDTPLHIACASCADAGGQGRLIAVLDACARLPEVRTGTSAGVAESTTRGSGKRGKLALEAPLLAQNQSGDTPLHVALAASAPLESVKLLLSSETGRQACTVLNNGGHSPLLTALFSRRETAVVAALLQTCPACAAEPDRLGLLPLHRALLLCLDVSIVALLLRACPNSVYAPAAALAVARPIDLVAARRAPTISNPRNSTFVKNATELLLAAPDAHSINAVGRLWVSLLAAPLWSSRNRLPASPADLAWSHGYMRSEVRRRAFQRRSHVAVAVWHLRHLGRAPSSKPVPER